MPNKTESGSTMEDPLVIHSLREAKWILAVWVVAFVWVVGYCSRYGYFREGEVTTTVCGVPAWVFWGVALPWAVSTVLSSWFALHCIVDEPLVEPTDLGRDDDE